ncbi:cell division-specific peptidoglycan biosynthesis regulator FtsW [Ferrimonas sediminum]|uniref:Probable peptidoglycan glycosyltransferase FtsW n=1 Tax=Ferrimonas sediminum TaxID=718193 RepID=A0A1G8KFE2_9GAMM|nr:cell division protein FtsW [Ferrimonas sediminum]SDI42141.1 cell division-specific peptidoglycan biosynthesis regulator FtsW [Ferrimonas sediminum]
MASTEQQLSLDLPRSGLMGWLGARSGQSPLYDRFLLLLLLTLAAIGLVMVTSASLAEAQSLTGDPLYFVKRHLAFLGGALVILALGLRIPMSWWQQRSTQLMLGGLVLIVLVLFVGRSVNGATRWLPLGPVNIQVAEVAKFTLFLYLAGYLVRRHQEVREELKGFLKPFVTLGVYAGFILAQPDLGTVVVMFVTVMGMLFLAGAKLRDFFALMLLGVSLVVGLIISAPYRLRRVTSFWDPWADPFGAGYQLTQSLMAYGRGDWLGQGLGNSIQKLEYLPEAHTDFIFAVLGEELGFAGVTFVLLLELALALRALRIGNLALQANQAFAGYFAYGIGIWFSFQTAVNVGASVGLLPTKGLTLPMVSYGGSSLWVMTVAAVVLLRVDYERRLAGATPGKKGGSDDGS